MRLRILFSTLKAMFFVTAPAAFLVWTCVWLLRLALSGAFFAWILLVLATPWAFLALAVALPVDFFLAIGLLALITGRQHLHVHYSTRASSYRPVKDVFPIELPPPQP